VRVLDSLPRLRWPTPSPTCLSLLVPEDIMHVSIRTSVVPPLLLLVACGDPTPVPPLELAQAPPPVAAEFRTTSGYAPAGSSSTVWRFWRSHDRIERENPVAQSGDLWVRYGKTLFHTRLYHADRRGIEHRSEDLQILDASPQWTTLSTLLDPRLLEALREHESGWRDGYPYRRYAGEVEGVAWDITVRTDRMLPTRIARRSADRQVETVELLRSFDFGHAPWQPTDSARYDLVDAADLGDHERDPFVMRIQAVESSGHPRGRAH
jgi:hypothetical protein